MVEKEGFISGSIDLVLIFFTASYQDGPISLFQSLFELGSCTGCVICIWTVIQMGIAQKWLKPGSSNFSQFFIRVLSNSLENLKAVPLKLYHSWPQKEQKIGVKKGHLTCLIVLLNCPWLSSKLTEICHGQKFYMILVWFFNEKLKIGQNWHEDFDYDKVKLIIFIINSLFNA